MGLFGKRPGADALLEAAQAALDAEDFAGAAGKAREAEEAARRAGDAGLQAEAHLLLATAANQAGESAVALAAADALLALEPEAVDGMLERAFALWELLRLDEAKAQCLAVLRASPDEAWAIHTLGLVAERRGDLAEAERRFARARRLAPEDFPAPVRLPAAEFDAAVEAALEELPPQVRAYLANVPVSVEELPADEDLRAGDPPLSPAILGLFRGAAHGQKGSDPWSHFPSAILLYQRNLERFARSREELVEEIGITLVHEVGHFLGLDEEELWERGLG